MTTPELTPAPASPASEHREARDEPVRCVVVTVSDTRTVENDRSGALMRERLEAAGHVIAHSTIVRDEPDLIRTLLDTWSVPGACDVILFNGGTGISARDTTFDAISSRLEKVLPGFGELFRMLSYAEIGGAAMLSRATAGTLGSCLVFSTPGSSNAVALAMDKLIVPELQHLVFELRKHLPGGDATSAGV